MSSKRSEAKSLTKAFKKMSHRKKGGTKGTFTAAATKAGHEDSPEGRKAFANKVLNDPDATPKMKKKANFYKNIISK
jgi:hypothetical protein